MRRRKGHPLPETLGALIIEYRKSPEFRETAPNTQRAYEAGFKLIQDLYNVEVRALRQRHVKVVRDRLRKTPSQANRAVKVLSILFNYGIELEWCEVNPAFKMKKLRIGEYARWSDAAVEYAVANLPERFVKSVILGLYTGQRECDVIGMRWTDYDGAGIRVVQAKTRKPLWIPAHNALRSHLDAWKRDALTIIADSAKRPYKARSFSTVFSRELRQHKTLDGLVYHGLRKTAAAKLAEAGCSIHEIAAITGHLSLQMIQLYTKEAEQKVNASAAIVKLESYRSGPQ